MHARTHAHTVTDTDTGTGTNTNTDTKDLLFFARKHVETLEGEMSYLAAFLAGTCTHLISSHT